MSTLRKLAKALDLDPAQLVAEVRMPSTNGHGCKRAVLYARVSTDEQARSGYSLAQQLGALQGSRGP